MAEQYSVKAVLSAVDSGFTSTMGSARKSMSGLDDNTQKTNMSILQMAAGAAVFKALTVATNVLTASVGKAVDRYDTLNSYPRVLQQLGYSTMEADSSTRKLSDGINGLPTSLDEVVSTAQRLTILTGNLEESTDLTIALNNAFLASGASSDKAARGTEQYISMLSRGEVNLTSWRTLQETMGYALSETAKKMGIASGDANELYDALNDGLFTFDEFSAALIECSEQAGGFAEVALTASEGVRTSFENVKTAVVRNLANIIEAFDDMLVEVTGLNIAGHLNNLKNVVDTSMGAMTKVIKVFGSTLSTLLPIVKPLTPALVGMATAMAVHKVVSKASQAIAGYRIMLTAFNAAVQKSTASTAAQTAMEKVATIAKQHGMSATVAQTVADKAYTAAVLKQTAGVKMITAVQAAYNAVKQKAIATNTASIALTNKMIGLSTKEVAVKTAAMAVDEKRAAITTKMMVLAAKDIAMDKIKLAMTTAKTIAMSSLVTVTTANSTATGIATLATKAFGVALKVAMGPIGWVTLGVGALAGGIYALAKRFGSGTEEGKKFKKELKDLSKATDKVVDSVASNAEAHAENIGQINASAGANQELAKRVQDLAAIENKSAGEKAQLKALTEQLNEAVPGLNAAYDEQTDSLNLSEEAMSNYIETMKKQAEAQAYQDRLKQAIEDRIKVEEQQNAVLVKQEEIKADSNITDRERNKLMKETEEQLEDLMYAHIDAEATATYYGDKVAEAHEKAAQAATESAEQARISFEDLSESQQAAVSTLIDRYDALAAGAQNAFEKMRHETEETTQSMLETLNHNATQTEKYAENLAKLHERAGEGSHENFTKWLDTMTEDNAAELAVMVNMTDEEMKQYEDALERGAKAGMQGVAAETGLGVDEVAETLGVFASEIPQTLREQMEAEMPSVGAAIPEGMKVGIEEGKEDSIDAAREMMKQLIEASKNEAGVNSPSRVYKEMGGHLIDGLVLGVEGKQSNAVTAMQKVLQAMQKAVDSESKNMSKSFDQIVTGADSSLSKLPNVANKSMAAMESQFKSGARTSQSTMRNLSNQLVQAFSRTPNQMQNVGRNSMNSLDTGLRSRQSAVQTTASQTHTRIIQAFNRTPSQLQTVGRNSMTGLNNGLRSNQGSAISTAQTTSSRIVSAFNGLPSQLNQSGRNAMAGLTAGINAGAGGAIAAANRVANQVSATINKALDINSPSRVTKKSGAFASEGLEVGLLSRINQVASAARQVTDALIDNISPGIDLQANLGFSTSGGIIDSNLGKNKMSMSPIQIVNKLILDGKQIAGSTNTILASDYEKLAYAQGGLT